MDDLSNRDIVLQNGSPDVEPSVRIKRRTASDDILDLIHNDIVTLEIEPGAKMSETEVAKLYGVSRQPVREAFIRLSEMKLLEIRPQRATIVRKINYQEILDTRFIRTAIEVEVARHACRIYDGFLDQRFMANLSQQSAAMDTQNFEEFHALDYEFHKLLCIAADEETAYGHIVENKSQMDRIWALSPLNPESYNLIHEDHVEIFEALKARDSDAVISRIRLHLSRLDDTIGDVRNHHSDFFDD